MKFVTLPERCFMSIASVMVVLPFIHVWCLGCIYFFSCLLTLRHRFALQKQELQEGSAKSPEQPVSRPVVKVIRQFQQKQPVAENAAQNKPRLSKDILAGVSFLCQDTIRYIYLRTVV